MTPELEHYLQFFETFYQEMGELIGDLTPEALNWRPLETGPASSEGQPASNSLAALVAHVAGSTRFLVGELAGGRPAHRDRPAEFRVTAESAAALQQRLDEIAQLVRDVLTRLAAEQLDEGADFRGRPVTRRWTVIHALEHSSEHKGQMALTRQLWEARDGG